MLLLSSFHSMCGAKERHCLTVFSNQWFDLPQVKELQSKLTDLVREKTDTLSLKKQIEEQYNILAAQLKAKVRMKECFLFGLLYIIH